MHAYKCAGPHSMGWMTWHTCVHVQISPEPYACDRACGHPQLASPHDAICTKRCYFRTCTCQAASEGHSCWVPCIPPPLCCLWHLSTGHITPLEQMPPMSLPLEAVAHATLPSVSKYDLEHACTQAYCVKAPLHRRLLAAIPVWLCWP